MVRLSGMEFVTIMALALAVLSYTIPTPPEFGRLGYRVDELDGCGRPMCLAVRAEMGVFNAEIRNRTVSQVLRGDVWGALAYLAGSDDEAVRSAFAERIDAEVERLELSEATLERVLLVAYEMDARLEREPGNATLRAKRDAVVGWLIANPSDTVLYHYVMKSIARGRYERDAAPSANASAAVRLAYTFENLRSVNELFLFPSGEQRELAAQVWADFERETDPELLAGDMYVLLYYETARYPSYVIRPGIPALMFVYSLPVALVCIIPAITFFTMRGRDRRSAFQRERAKNILLAGALLLLLIPVLANGLMLVPLAPYAALLVFFLPPIAAIYIYMIASLSLQRKHGIIREMTIDIVLERLRRSFWVLAFGALFTILAILLATNVQRFTAFLGWPLAQIAVPAFFILVVLVFFPVVPRLLELVTGSFEVVEERVRRRLDRLCSKFGYTVESIRIVPTLGSTLTNAFQVGLRGRNVRIFVFDTLLDRRLFTEDELEAVVAHELAHVEKGHVLKMVVGYVSSYLLFILLISAALLPFDPRNAAVRALTFLAPYASLVLSVLVTLWIRRRFEGEADARAAELGYGKALLSALKKIYRLNLVPSQRSKLLTVFSSHGDLRSRMRELYRKHGKPER